MLRLVIPGLKVLGAAALLTSLPQAAQAQSRTGGLQAAQQSPLQREIADRIDRELRPFYAARQFRPLWLNEFGRPSGAAGMLMHHLRTSQFDGVDPKNFPKVFDHRTRMAERANVKKVLAAQA